MGSKNKVEIKLERLDPMENPADSSIITDSLHKADIKEESCNPATVISRADHPIEVMYGGETIRMSPRQVVEVADSSKIDTTSLSPLIIIVKK
jgi:hypothetical protein